MHISDEQKALIKALCQQYGVRRLYVFGSVLSDHFSEQSDLDFIVDFTTIMPQHYADNYFHFKFALEDAFRRPVDLIEEKALRNPYFKQSVEAKRQLLYAA